MPPSESSILSTYLLTPAHLTDIATLRQFRALFARPAQQLPQVQSLYRDLHAQRNAVIGRVTANIADEAKRSKALRRQIVAARIEPDHANADVEIQIEAALFGAESGCLLARHTLHTVIDAMDAAAEDLGTEIEHLEAEERQLTETIAKSIGSLSDLRYGKLGNSHLRDELLQGIDALLDACNHGT